MRYQLMWQCNLTLTFVNLYQIIFYYFIIYVSLFYPVVVFNPHLSHPSELCQWSFSSILLIFVIVFLHLHLLFFIFSNTLPNTIFIFIGVDWTWRAFGLNVFKLKRKFKYGSIGSMFKILNSSVLWILNWTLDSNIILELKSIYLN